MDFLGMGLGEILLIIIIAIIFLGPAKIVDFSRTLGKWVRAVRKAGNDFTAAVTREVEKAAEEPPVPPVEEDKTTRPTVTADNRQSGASREEKGAPEK